MISPGGSGSRQSFRRSGHREHHRNLSVLSGFYHRTDPAACLCAARAPSPIAGVIAVVIRLFPLRDFLRLCVSPDMERQSFALDPVRLKAELLFRPDVISLGHELYKGE